MLGQDKAEGGRTPIVSQQSFSLLFGLSSLPCVSKAASSKQKINRKFLAERCLAVFSGLHFSRQRKSRRQYSFVLSRDFLQYWEMQASENLSVFDSPQPNLRCHPAWRKLRPLCAYKHTLTVCNGVSAPAHILVSFLIALGSPFSQSLFTALPPSAARYGKKPKPTHSSATVFSIICTQIPFVNPSQRQLIIDN